ncbi:hypothetical protein Pfo_027315 [Paulownia fortunei]|nr:hypothetical protein Pfo_027315 [Paulownia fortunei]
MDIINNKLKMRMESKNAQTTSLFSQTILNLRLIFNHYLSMSLSRPDVILSAHKLCLFKKLGEFYAVAYVYELFFNHACSYGISDRNLARSEVIRISIMTMMSRCDFMFLELGSEFLASSDGGRIVLLSKLACIEGVSKENLRRCSHLLVLFPTFFELVISRVLSGA